MRNKLGNEELFNFCEQFSIILHSGISSAEGLHILCEDSTSQQSRELFSALLSHLEETGCLSEALSLSGLFPASLISYVKVGEETGCLDEVMTTLSQHYQQELEISQHIKSAVTYPLIMLGMMAAVIVILLVKVLPVFQQVFRQMGMEMSGISQGLLKAGTAVSRYSTILLAVAAILIVCLLFICLNPRGRQIFKKAVSSLPRLREIPVAIDYGRLTQGMALGLRSGLGPETSLGLARELISHPLVIERLEKADAILSQGAPLSQAMTDSGLFQGMEARLISVGFHAGSGDEVMAKLSQRYRSDAVSMISHIVSIVEPAIVIVLSLLVGLVLLSVMMPLLGILSEMIV